MKKTILAFFKIALLLYIVLCGILYFFQEKVIFLPIKLAKNFQFQFDQNFEERNFKTSDNTLLNGLLFKAENSKGLIFYLHGNAGNLSSWGFVAKTYTDLNYDVLMLDYRGYGKSEGKITSQNQLFNDVQTVYNTIKKEYSEDKIIVLGYSIGTGMASKLASNNHPKLLILQAPYYSLTDLMKRTIPFVPSFILKYKLENNRYLKDCKMPVILFHGEEDQVIYPESSLKLKEACKCVEKVILLDKLGHNGMTDDLNYKREIKKILQ
ncbi:alpha/beta hydrolase [Flavobacterium jejuense]|uniref:Alpha/beta hydrolase n=1 Tax=Flavobacterium jejuense TaxID=1544455 RepID=A0ABX0IUU4_9FLAO|nr:alpha/beta fold hydrolase [Flavobacterium jejuense]NHN26920.1 alpha/beta hydrolase [Flavobacterium jejuense]